MKSFLILFSFLMAFHLVAGSSYGLFQINAEELVENNVLQELLENHTEKLADYILPTFGLKHPMGEKEGAFQYSEYTTGFSTYVQEIHVPPPNFFPVLS